MKTTIETLFDDVQKVVAELEKLLATSSGDTRAHAEAAVSDWRDALKDAQGRLEKLQESTRKRVADAARTASHALRDNPGKSLAIVAATGFLLGLALRGHGEPRR
ncbi:MAG TPA: hypothetical protein VGR80_13080 [Steroidobacteraceae bacterium]|nr:hypothetical protein [Steroidobacteraceae bacterium]